MRSWARVCPASRCKVARPLAPDMRLVQRERAIADYASTVLGRVACIAKIEQPHLRLACARDVHEPVYTGTAREHGPRSCRLNYEDRAAAPRARVRARRP